MFNEFEVTNEALQILKSITKIVSIMVNILTCSSKIGTILKGTTLVDSVKYLIEKEGFEFKRYGEKKPFH